MKFYVDGERFTEEEKENLKKQGKYVAEIREAEDNEDSFYGTIEPFVLVNHIASIITDEEIDFSDYDDLAIDYEEFALENEEVESIDELQKGVKIMENSIVLNEIVKRMKKLQLHENVIKDFMAEKRLLNYSEPQRFGNSSVGILYWVEDEEILNKIKEVEKEYDVTVYHLIHSYTQFGELYSMLYVENSEENYGYDNELLDEGIQYAYVWNKDDDDCSEFGTIGIKPAGGGAIRVS